MLTAPQKKGAVKCTAHDPISNTTSIDTNDSTNYLNNMVSWFGLKHHLNLVDNQEYAFYLTNQVTLHIDADGGGILGDTGGGSRTIRTNGSTPILGTTKDYLKPHINYLLAPLVIPNQDLSLNISKVASLVVEQATQLVI